MGAFLSFMLFNELVLAMLSSENMLEFLLNELCRES